MEAENLDQMVENLLHLKGMFYKGYTEEEVARLPSVLKEEVKKLTAFEETEKDVGIKMVAWVAYASK